MGTVADDPGMTTNGYYQFTLKSHGTRAKVVTYTSHLQRGYTVAVTGKVQPGYGANSVELGFGQVEILSTKQSLLERWRQRFLAGVHNALPSPLAEFGLGLLIGTRALIPKTLQEQLTIVGLSHLVAVSGYNLTIIVQAMRRLFANRSKFLATSVCGWGILGFLLVTGFSPSIVRAAWVSGLMLLAAYYGREFKPHVIISVVAAITAGINPGYVRDLGWQLSFLAFFGILVLGPAIEARLKIKGTLAKMTVESLAAQLMTTPLIAFTFHQMSLVAPLSNLLILPLVPAMMLLCLVAGLVGMTAPSPLLWLALPAGWILQIVVSSVEQMAGWQWSSAGIQVSSLTLVLIYGLLAAVLAFSRRRPRPLTD